MAPKRKTYPDLVKQLEPIIEKYLKKIPNDFQEEWWTTPQSLHYLIIADLIHYLNTGTHLEKYS